VFKLSSYQSNKSFSEWSYARVREQYPKSVDAARDLIIEYLRKYDPQKLLVFLGEVADDGNDAYNLHESFFLISDILNDEQNGKVSLSPMNKDVIIRGYLQLPFATIGGGLQQ